MYWLYDRVLRSRWPTTEALILVVVVTLSVMVSWAVISTVAGLVDEPDKTCRNIAGHVVPCSQPEGEVE